MSRLSYSRKVSTGWLLVIISQAFILTASAQPANNNCGGAVTLTVNSGSCAITTNGTTVAATQSQSRCSGPASSADDDVWYRFVATGTSHTITVTPNGAPALGDPVFEVFSGTCAVTVVGSLVCVNANGAGLAETTTLTGLTIGNTYLMRVYGTGVATGQGGFTVCLVGPSANEACASAVSLTPANSCTPTLGALHLATASGVAAPSCGGNADDDVWYSFTATTHAPVITLTPAVTNPMNMNNIRTQLYQGTCGSLNSLSFCGSLSGSTFTVSPTGLTIGSTYFIRVYSSGAGSPPLANNQFNICVTTPQVVSPIYTGKSYVNITKSAGGGTIEAGDILDVRATICVGNWNSDQITNVRYCDTIGSSLLTYIPNSMRIVTNEGLGFLPSVAGFYTDAAGDDPAYYDGAGRLRVNVGSTHNKFPWDASPTVPNFFNTGSACSSVNPAVGGGGLIQSNGRPSFGGGRAIISVSYRVRVNTGLPLGTQITMNGGTFYFDNGSTATTRGFVSNTIELSTNQGLCSNASGVSTFTNENGGTFGSGNTQNRAVSAIIPDYGFINPHHQR